MKEGELYTLTLWAKSDRERPLMVNACVDYDDYHETGLNQRLTLRPEWRKFNLVFTASRTVKGQDRITFVLGDTVGSIDVDGIGLRRGAVTRPLGANLLRNSDFALDQEEWAHLVVVPPAAGTLAFVPGPLPSGVQGHVARFNITALGKENWNVHFYQAG